MKRVFYLLTVLTFISCHKDDNDKSVFVKSNVSFRASYVNLKFEQCYDSIYIDVKGSQSFAFATHSNPCLNISYGFNMWAKDSTTYSPYVIRTERDTIENGLLKFTPNGELVFKQ